MTGVFSRDVLIRGLYSLFGVALIGLGAAVLQVGGVGVDPYTAMNIGISETIGWSLGSYQLLSNLVLFVPVLLWGRKYIGVGTVVNMVLTGYFIDFFAGHLRNVVPDDPSPLGTAVAFVIGIVVFDFGASAYMSAGVGTAPYDALAPMIVDRTGLPYHRVRVPQDLLVLVVAIVFHGQVGVGTVMTAFFNGPLIQFFSEHANRKIVTKLTRDHRETPNPDAGAPGDPTRLLDKRAGAPRSDARSARRDDHPPR